MHLMRDVKMRSGLIQQQELWLLGKRLGNSRQLLFAATQFRHPFVLETKRICHSHLHIDNLKIFIRIEKIKPAVVGNPAHQYIFFHVHVA
jgi:hypothetical protein